MIKIVEVDDTWIEEQPVALTEDGKTLWQEAHDSARMLGCAMFATLCTLIGLALAAAVILLGGD